MSVSTLPIIRIAGGHFRKKQAAKPIYRNLNLIIPPFDASKTPERWAITGKGKSTVFQILQGKYHCQTLDGRTYPALAAKNAWPDSCIGLVEFTATGSLGEGLKGDYMSSR